MPTEPGQILAGTFTGLIFDNNGNIFLPDYGNHTVAAICYDNTAPGACFGRTAGNVYYYAGTASEGAAADGVAATAGNLGRIFGIQFDSFGNLLLAELQNTGKTVRAVCNYDAALLGGVCASRGAGTLYKTIGTGVNGDNAGNVPASTNTVGNLRSVTVDAHGNIWVSDGSYDKVRVRCEDTTTTTNNFCEGKTAGNIYTYSATSWLTPGANALAG
jgi:hypothetical protein